jgi:hypothetical protein
MGHGSWVEEKRNLNRHGAKVAKERRAGGWNSREMAGGAGGRGGASAIRDLQSAIFDPKCSDWGFFFAALVMNATDTGEWAWRLQIERGIGKEACRSISLRSVAATGRIAGFRPSNPPPAGIPPASSSCGSGAE